VAGRGRHRANPDLGSGLDPCPNPAQSRRIAEDRHALQSPKTVATPSDSPIRPLYPFVLLSGRSRFDSWRGHCRENSCYGVPRYERWRNNVLGWTGVVILAVIATALLQRHCWMRRISAITLLQSIDKDGRIDNRDAVKLGVEQIPIE
jgi:hypothetical protein